MDSFLEVLRLAFSSFDAAAPVQTDFESINLVVNLVQWGAIIISALAGVYEAKRRDLDFFGALVIACVVSLGGGTVRDVLLGRTPLFWITTPIYVLTVIVVALIGLLSVTPQAKLPNLVDPLIVPVRKLMRDDGIPMWVIALDALALGLWAYLGTYYSLAVGSSRIVAPALGIITASFGGVIRDVFFAQVPSVFRRGQLYATSAALGSVVYVVALSFGISELISFFVCVIVTFTSRMLAVRYDIQSL